MIDLSMPLSENFTLGELLLSDTAERNEDLKLEQYNPPPEIVENLQYLYLRVSPEEALGYGVVRS